MNRLFQRIVAHAALPCLVALLACAATAIHAQSQTGKASYYSKKATGSRTASGAHLHHDSLTCAHRTYPFGTLLRVTHLGTGKQVVVKVTDRGPFVRGRVIDLSWGAARELGMLAQGIAMVKVEPVSGTEVPFRPEEKVELPEMDYQVTDMPFEFPIPSKTPEQAPLLPVPQEKK